MNKTSVLELIFYAVLQRSEKQQLIRKFATQTLDKNFDAILGEVFINTPKKSMNKTSVLELIFYTVLQRSEKQQLIRKFATQTLDKNFDAILGEVFINTPKK